MFRTANPALNKNTFQNLNYSGNNYMTIDGTVNKSILLLIVLLIPAFYTWNLFLQESPLVMGLLILGVIGGLITAIITIFKRQWAPLTAILYAGFEGLVLGGLSSMFEAAFPGIVIQAVGLTFGTMFALLFIYKARIIKVTENFRMGVFAATGAVALVYLVTWILSFFGIRVGFIHEAGLIGIGFSLVVVVIAALNLVLDFDFIEHGAREKAPKYMESYAAFGLLVTLIWLYIEILRLLSKLRSRN